MSNKDSVREACAEAAKMLDEIDAERGYDRFNQRWRPVATSVEGLLSFKLPALLFEIDGRVGVVLSLYTHPDVGAIFDAEIRFDTGVESWRGKNMRGRFFIGEYAGIGVAANAT